MQILFRSIFISFFASSFASAICMVDPVGDHPLNNILKQFEGLIDRKECTGEEYVADPCGCWNKKGKLSAFGYGKELNQKNSDIQRRINEMQLEKKQKAFNRWYDSILDTTQNLLYFDQMIRYNMISPNLLAPIASCSLSGLLQKVESKLPSSCKSEFLDKINEYESNRQSEKVSYKNLDDYMKQISENLGNITDNKQHKKPASCVPYATYTNAMLSWNLSDRKKGFDSFNGDSHLDLPEDVRLSKNSRATFAYRRLKEIDTFEDFKEKYQDELHKFNYVGGDEDLKDWYKNSVSSIKLQYSLSKINSKDPIFKLTGDLDFEDSQRVNQIWNEGVVKFKKENPDLPVPFSDILLESEEAMAIIMSKQGEKCYEIFDGQLLVDLACNDVEITPEELANDKEVNKILKSEGNEKSPVAMLVRNYCEPAKDKLTGQVKERKKAVELDDFIKNAPSKMSELDDLIAHDTSDGYKKTTYEYFDEMYCRMFDECDVRKNTTINEKCSDPKFLQEKMFDWTKKYFDLSKLADPNNPMSFIKDGAFDWSSLLSANPYELNKFLQNAKSLNEEEKVAYVLIFNQIFAQTGALNIEAGQQSDLLDSPTSRFREVTNAFRNIRDVTTGNFANGNSNTNTSVASNFGGSSINESNAPIMTNYMLRSSKDEYNAVTIASNNYNPSNSTNFSINYTRQSTFDSGRNSNSIISSITKNDVMEPVAELKTEPKIITSSELNKTLPSVKEYVADIGENVTNNTESSILRIDKNNYQSSSDQTYKRDLTQKISPTPNPITDIQEIKIDDKNPITEKEVAESNYDFDKINSKRRADYEARRKSIMDEIKRIQAEIDRTANENDRMRNEVAIADAKKRIRQMDEQRSVANKTPYSMSESKFSSNNEANKITAENNRLPASVSDGNQPVQKGKNTINGRVVELNPEQAARINLVRSNLAKNGIARNSQTGQIIESIESELAIKGIDSLLFDEKGKRRKLIPSEFVIPQGFTTAIDAYREVGKREVGVLSYDSNSKSISVVVYKHKRPQDFISTDKSDLLPLDMRVKFYERNFQYVKIGTLAKQYKVARILNIPFQYGASNLKEIGFTLNELWEKTTEGYTVE